MNIDEQRKKVQELRQQCTAASNAIDAFEEKGIQDNAAFLQLANVLNEAYKKFIEEDSILDKLLGSEFH